MVASVDLGSLVPVLGWTLAHFLWQGALVALVLQVLLKTCKTAKARHDLALAALLLMALLPIATFVLLRSEVRIVQLPGVTVRGRFGWESAAVAIWLVGVAGLAIRTAGGLWLVERLRRGATPLPAIWVGRCETLQMRMAGSLKVLFAQSEAIATPLVAGWLKPMVLIPAVALTRLPADQLEALILHELAHVRRLDAFANLVQTVVETLLFYHPAVWWVSRHIRAEREHCCDDLAVAAVQDRALYVRALQAMEVLRASPRGVLAANGGDLKRRAARILGLAAAPTRPALSRTAAMLILMAPIVAMTHSVAVEAKPTKASASVAIPAALPFAAPTPEVTAGAQLPSLSPQDRPIILAETATPLAASYSVAAIPTQAAAQTAAPSPPTVQLALASSSVAALVVSPRTPGPADLNIEMQGSESDVDQQVVVWPHTAYAARFDGRVTLRCMIDVHGLAERCEVASEAPAGKDFGRAALEMRPTFKFAPATGPDGPVRSTVTISIRFKAPEGRIEEPPPHTRLPGEVGAPAHDYKIIGNPLPMHDVTMLDYPVWVQAATFDDLARAYPARGGNAEGYAVAHCIVRRSGALDGCQVIRETPEHRDFGKAALGLAAKFRVAPQLAASHHSAELWVDVPIRMPPPHEIADRTVTAPTWIFGIDPRTAPKLFPPEAVASGLTSGRGVARCVVGEDGSLTQCTPEAAEPDGLGFSEAAAKLASAMKINLWSADGAPVEGGVVHVPVRLNLKGG